MCGVQRMILIILMSYAFVTVDKNKEIGSTMESEREGFTVQGFDFVGQSSECCNQHVSSHRYTRCF
jgi:hypothetical protein